MSLKLKQIESEINKIGPDSLIEEINYLRTSLDNYRRTFTASPVSGTPEISRLYELLAKKEKQLNTNQL